MLAPPLSLPRFWKGELMHDVALDDEVSGDSRPVTVVAPGGRGCSFTSGGPVLLGVFVLVEWASFLEVWRAAGAASAVAVVFVD